MQRLQDSSSLIPGLPHDIATLCLLRVSVESHASCKRVSKSWNSIFKSKRRFRKLREKFRFRNPQLFVFASNHHTERIHAHVLDLTTLSWHEVRVIPDLYHGRGNFNSASIPHEGVLFAFGGVACCEGTVNVFLKYEVHENRWTVIKAMAGRLGLVTSGVVDGKVYVTGLDKELSDGEHGPFEVLDPRKGTWRPVDYDARAHEDFQGATIFRGKILLTYRDDSTKTGRVYDPRADKWEDMAGELRKGLRGRPAVEIHGHLFVLAPEDESGLRVYDAQSDRWDAVEGNAMPEGVDVMMSKVSCWDGKIYIVKDFVGGVVVGDISSSKYGFRVRWEGTVDPPEPGLNVDTLCAHVIVA